MVSYKSCLTFIYINTFLISLTYFCVNYFFIGTFIRNISLMCFINYGTKNKINIGLQKKTSLKDYIYFISSTLIQSLTELFVQRFSNENDGVYFLQYLFLFELLVDLLHYTGHRISHTYYYFHKTHHHYQHPKLLNTYYHHPIDLFLIESIPTIISFYLIPFNPFQIKLVLVYKSFIEISGHSGKRVKPSSCFPLCVWLPRILGIELYTEDHDLHHSENNCNYSKRFSLWDRLFGTYRS